MPLLVFRLKCSDHDNTGVVCYRTYSGGWSNYQGETDHFVQEKGGVLIIVSERAFRRTEFVALSSAPNRRDP